MKNTYYLIAISMFLVVSLFACKETEPSKPTNDEELITTLKLTVYNQSDSSLVGTFVFKDADGAGGQAPSQWDTIKLGMGNYWMRASMYNESNPSDIIDITPEIIEEADEHLLFYNHNLSGFTIDYVDNFNGLPLGIVTTCKATMKEKGVLTVILKHMPDGIKAVNPSIGDTDVEVSFQIEID